jgi:1,4-alpha-glucan branching enzyme
MDPDGGEPVLVACNFTPVPRRKYRVGVPAEGRWREILNTDAETYGGSGVGNMGGVAAAADPWHGLPASLELTLPPLAAIALQVER